MGLADRIKTGPSDLPPKIGITGVEGVGKSTAGNLLPNPLFMCVENGLVGAQFKNTKSLSPKTYEEACRDIEELTQDSLGYKSFVLDTVDWFEPLIERYICALYRKPTIISFGYNQGPKYVAIEFRNFLAKLEQLQKKQNMIILLNTHNHIKTHSNPLGDDYDRFELKCEKKIAALVKEWVDVLLFARFEDLVYKKNDNDKKGKGVGGEKRIVHTVHSTGYDAKNRYDLPSTMEFHMPSILESMKKGMAITLPKLLIKINELIPQLPKEKQVLAKNYIQAKPNDATALASLLNSIEVQLQQQTEGE